MSAEFRPKYGPEIRTQKYFGTRNSAEILYNFFFSSASVLLKKVALVILSPEKYQQKPHNNVHSMLL